MADDLPLTMIRPDLEGLPEFALPAPYSFRWYAAGDGEAWAAIQAPSYEPGAITPELFREQYGGDDRALAQRLCFLLDLGGTPIGSATAWTYDGYGNPSDGRIHWVALLPAYQGLGLSKPLLSVVCRRLRELGHLRAYLTTSRSRPIAIALYHKFGFVEAGEP
jgi:GNAT superfamily N-acetyltransferase